MNEETTNPTEEVEVTQGVEDAPEIETDDFDDSESQPEEDDSEEIDYDGEKYRVPKKLKDAFLRNADYTQKTQTLAEERRAVAVERQAAEAERQKVAQATQEQLVGLARLVAIEERINEFNGIDWNSLTAADATQAQQLWMQLAQLKESKSALTNQLQQQKQQRDLETQQSLAKRIEESQSVIAQHIKGWNQQIADQLTEYAVKTFDFQPHEVAQANVDPRIALLIHAAFVGEQLMSKQQAASKPKAPELKPVTKVGGNSAKTNKDPAQMSDAEFATWRRRQIAQRR